MGLYSGQSAGRAEPVFSDGYELAYFGSAPIEGATRQPLPALVFLISHLALTVGRCRSVLKLKRWPPWFQQLWKTFPSEHRNGIASADFGWFAQVVQWAQGQGGHSAVYALYSHSGLYLGKANLLRKEKQVVLVVVWRNDRLNI